MRKVKNIRCRVCRQSFEPSRSWHRFCSDACRQKAWKMPKRIAQAELVCIYCGEIGESIDHVPPRVSREKLIELGLVERYPFFEVRACRECNCALGKLALWTLRERKRYIKEWIERRYRKYLMMPEWEPKDIMDLGENLQREVVHGVAMKRWVERRLKF